MSQPMTERETLSQIIHAHTPMIYEDDECALIGELVAFITQVRAEEREACAKVALDSKHIATPENITDRIRHWNDACRWVEEAIRGRDRR